MPRLATVAIMVLFAALFARWVPLVRLFEAFQTMTVALSIMAGAVLVRLNRGMPTLDWKSVEPSNRTQLTTRVVQLTGEYAVIVGINCALLVALVSLTVVGKSILFGTSATAAWPDPVQRIIAGAIGGLSALSIVRMAYVIWRDYDIVRLQKAIIDAAAQRDEADRQAKVADEKVANIRGAGLRPIASAERKPWDS